MKLREGEFVSTDERRIEVKLNDVGKIDSSGHEFWEEKAKGAAETNTGCQCW